MYLNDKIRISELLDSVIEALEYCKKQDDINVVLVRNCMDAVLSIEIFFSDCSNKIIKENLHIIIQNIDEILQNEKDEKYERDKKYKKLIKLIIKTKNNLELIDVKYRALFLPYKASMWKSLESIWISAKEDSNCEPAVVVIPYYDLDAHGNKTFLNYEINEFPDDVPIISYKYYDISKICPEMIYIHNPYDDMNTLTRVPEEFYSRNLRKHTRCLVYSPYFTLGAYGKNHKGLQYQSIGSYNADKIVVQSKRVADIFKVYKHKGEQLMICGSPKIDSIMQSMKKTGKIPEEWEEKLIGKKVFLLNTHLSYFISSWIYSNQSDIPRDDFAVRIHNEILRTFLNRKDCALIWRPHPLLKSMIRQRLPQRLQYIEFIENEMEKSSNCVIDTTGDYSKAFNISDSLITTYSSLLNEYMVTGKPVLIYQNPPSKEDAEVAPINYLCNYFYSSKKCNGRINFDEFIEMVKQGKDAKKEERMAMLQEAFVNMGGTAGRTCYEKVLEYIYEV